MTRFCRSDLILRQILKKLFFVSTFSSLKFHQEKNFFSLQRVRHTPKLGQFLRDLCMAKFHVKYFILSIVNPYIRYIFVYQFTTKTKQK